MKTEYQEASDLITRLRSLVESLPYTSNSSVVSGDTLRLGHQQGEVLASSRYPQLLEILEVVCGSVSELEYLLGVMDSYVNMLEESEMKQEELREQSEELSYDKELLRARFEDYVQEHPPKKRWLKEHGQPWQE